MSVSHVIKALAEKGLIRDQIYEEIAGRYGLYHVAFFGARLRDKNENRKAHRKLNYAWKRILELVPNGNPCRT